MGLGRKRFLTVLPKVEARFALQDLGSCPLLLTENKAQNSSSLLVWWDILFFFFNL